MPGTLGVGVVEPHELIRRGLVDMLAEIASVTTFAYGHIEELLADEHAETIRVVITSASPSTELVPQLPDAAREGRELLVLVPNADDVCLAAATRMNADGYLMADEVSAATIAQALERIVAGETPMPREIARFLGDRSRLLSTSVAQLTPRETEVVKLMVEGMSNKQIAYHLGISTHGAKRHVSNIISKLGCTSRTQVVARSLHLI